MAAAAYHFDEAKRPRAIIKHSILKSYVNGWLPKFLHSRHFESRPLVIVDGFAGVGSFNENSGDNGDILIEDYGSPLVLLDALYNHNVVKKKKGTIVLVLIEFKENNFNRLQTVVSRFEQNKPKDLVTEIRVELHLGGFNEVMLQTVLPKYLQSPMFVFADPFGYSDLKMSTFNEILRTHDWNCPKELFINFMDSYIRRFERNPLAQAAQDELFGTSSWRVDFQQADPDLDKGEILCNLFIQKLHEAYPDTMWQKNKYSLRFGIRGDRNDPVYHLIFVTHHEAGLNTMKGTMHKYSQSPAYYVFSEWINKKEFVRDSDVERNVTVKDTIHLILQKFKGQDVTGKMIRDSVMQETPFFCNFVVKIKNELKNFATNSETERKFAELKYTFPDSVVIEEVLQWYPPTPRTGEKQAPMQQLVDQIQAKFEGRSNVTGSEILNFAEERSPGLVKTKKKDFRKLLQGYLQNSPRKFDDCVFAFQTSAVKRKLTFD